MIYIPAQAIDWHIKSVIYICENQKAWLSQELSFSLNFYFTLNYLAC